MNKSHSFVLRICHWLYCSKCGLIKLNNQATQDAINKPCPGSQ